MGTEQIVNGVVKLNRRDRRLLQAKRRSGIKLTDTEKKLLFSEGKPKKIVKAGEPTIGNCGKLIIKLNRDETERLDDLCQALKRPGQWEEVSRYLLFSQIERYIQMAIADARKKAEEAAQNVQPDNTRSSNTAGTSQEVQQLQDSSEPALPHSDAGGDILA